MFFGASALPDWARTSPVMFALNAGIPIEVPASTVGMVCGSGMKAIIEGARTILCGDADCVVAGGTENMSATPYYLPAARWGQRMNDSKIIDGFVKDGLWEAFNDYHMGITAENVADKYGITREEQDEFGFRSQQRAAQPLSGRFETSRSRPRQDQEGYCGFQGDDIRRPQP